MSEGKVFRLYAKEAMCDASTAVDESEKRTLEELAVIWAQAALMSDRVSAERVQLRDADLLSLPLLKFLQTGELVESEPAAFLVAKLLRTKAEQNPKDGHDGVAHGRMCTVRAPPRPPLFHVFGYDVPKGEFANFGLDPPHACGIVAARLIFELCVFLGLFVSRDKDCEIDGRKQRINDSVAAPSQFKSPAAGCAVIRTLRRRIFASQSFDLRLRLTQRASKDVNGFPSPIHVANFGHARLRFLKWTRV
jgi:hypothetical protein